MTQWIELTAADGFCFPAYQALPAGPARGAVIVLQEIFGLNSHIRAVVDGYAAQGYLAVAPSTFHRVRAGVELGYAPTDIAEGVALKALVEALPAPGVQHDIQAAVDYALQTSAGKVGVVGYCWGGLLAWRAACQLDNLSAAVPYYGGGMTLPAEVARTPRCAVLAHFAQHDQSIPLAGALAFGQAHPEVELHVYDASHGFNCDQRSAYNAGAAQLARQRSLAFFERVLRG